MEGHAASPVQRQQDQKADGDAAAEDLDPRWHPWRLVCFHERRPSPGEESLPRGLFRRAEAQLQVPGPAFADVPSDEAPSAALPDYEGLAQDLTALAYPLRLALLDALHVPQILSDIHVRPWKQDDVHGPDRLAAKQTVLSHLEKLAETGLVKLGSTARAGKTLTTYATNAQRLYALSEELRLVVQRHAGQGAAVDVTGTVPAPTAGRPVAGARLVVVHGAYQGRAYPVAGKTQVIGRATDAAVSLDYDPFISTHHAELRRTSTGWELQDLGGKNGTLVNWIALPRGASMPLAHGDIVGVGRSLLVFRST
jgi:FHA domain